MATSTSLNLRAILKAAVSRSGMDSSARTVSGLTPAAKALHVAAAAQARPHGVVLFVLPSDAELEQATGDVRFFLAALEGLASSAIERSVLPFPSHEVDPYRGLAPHVGVTSARARALHAIGRGTARVVVSSANALLPRVSAPGRLLAASIDLKPGQEIAPQDLAELLVDAGFSREDPADEHGEFAQRGGIVDIFPAGETHPVRLEFIGDTIETLRTYDPGTQRSIAPIDQVSIVPLRDVLATASGAAEDRSSTLFEHLSRAKDPRVIASEPDEVEASALKLIERVSESYRAITMPVGAERARPVSDAKVPPPTDLLADWPGIQSHLSTGTSLLQLGVGDESQIPNPKSHPIRCQPAVEMHGRLADWVAEIRRLREAGETTIFVAATTGRAERTIELLKEYDVLAVPVERAEDARYASVLVVVGDLSRGFRLPDAGLQIYAETDVFEEDRRAPERRRSATKAFLSDLRDLKVGDFVVHIDNGIGMFVGLKQIGIGPSTSSGQGDAQEFLELRYAGDDKLFVPVERLDLVQKYTGATKPALDRLGGTSWEKAKTRVKKAMRDMAEELLKLYAARKAVPGHAFSPDSHWQQEFEDAFEYELTPDQKSAITDIKRDMESSTPMDRLLCG
ncbi:MAG TPA: CarD family transcriptional regulator, partial [Vicinamibacterales bacterium]|nr:CarD family transcriptional regulator [Vicinamibacterales bacterium]